ncbi:ATP-grasp domain-containing protein [Pandoraea sp. NPDC087047]|uniref:ATP-grasp domain-containing protein n=1 Tax=Pandoraea sp. NPDC087047 TaxID=3364390 RepID=UPI0038218740
MVAALSDVSVTAATKRFVPEHFDAVVRLDGGRWPKTIDPERVKQVIAGSDVGVVSADALADQGNIPSRNEAKTSLLRRDKFWMGESLARKNIPHTRQVACSSSKELARWWSEQAIEKVVLKPRMSMASDLISICDSRSTAMAMADAMFQTQDVFGNKNTSILAQEFIEGAEYMLDTVSLDGVHHVVAIWSSHRSRSATPLPDYAQSLDAGDPCYFSLVNYGRRVLDALGVRYGPAHTEFIVHPTRGPLLVEINARCHGALSLNFSTEIYGTNQVMETARSVAVPDDFRRTPIEVSTQRMLGRKVYLRSDIDAKIVNTIDCSSLLAIDGVLSVDYRVRVGGDLTKTTSLSTSPGTVFVVAADARELEAAHRKIREEESGVLRRAVLHGDL